MDTLNETPTPFDSIESTSTEQRTTTNHEETIQHTTTHKKIADAIKFQPQSERPIITLLKALIPTLCLISFFSKSIWFYLTGSIALGCSYYLIVESHPQLIFLLHMFIGYHIQRLRRWYNLWLENIKNILIVDDRVKLEFKDGYGSLAYYDPTLKKQHIFLFKENRRLNDLIIFRDENEVDITDSIEPYLGPMQNFHGVPLTPKDFGRNKIKVFRDGEISLNKTFEKDEVINF